MMETGGLILIIDDDPLNIRLLGSALKEEFEIMTAATGTEALGLIAQAQPDLVLLDVVMPDLDGYEVCSRLKADPSTRHIPVLFLTGKTDIDSEVRGLELGAVDYLSKPFNLALVRARVRNHVELKRARDRLARLASTDGLTGLANRRIFDEALDREIKRLRRTEGRLSLILLDIDYFKRFNDRYGHLAGDECLVKVAAAIAGTLSRPADLAARYGGEEFTCILPETDHSGVLAVADNIRRRIIELAVPHDGSEVARHVTVSLGVATLLCTPQRTPSECIAAADEQLYLAKARGRNQTVAVDRSSGRELGPAAGQPSRR